MLDLYLRSHLKHGPHSIRSCLGRLAGFCVSIATNPALSQVGTRPLVVRSGVTTRPCVSRAAKPLLAELGDRPRLACAYVGRCPREDQERSGSGATHTKRKDVCTAATSERGRLCAVAGWLQTGERGAQKHHNAIHQETDKCHIRTFGISQSPMSE